MSVWDEMREEKAEDKTTHCPECRCGMQRSGLSVYNCYICGQRWRIVPEGIISDKRLASIHDGIPMDIE